MYDISMTVKRDMLVYKGKDEIRPRLSTVRDFNQGDAHESELKEKITAADLKEYEIEENSFIILKTKNSEPGFLEKTPEKFIYLAESGAEYLINKDIKGVGIDTNGIERSQSNH